MCTYIGGVFLTETRLLTLCRFHSKIITHFAAKKLLNTPPHLFHLEVKSLKSCCTLIAIKPPNYRKRCTTTDLATSSSVSNILKVTIVTNFWSVPENIQRQEIIQPLLPFCSPLHSILPHFNIIRFWSAEFKAKAVCLTKHLEIPALQEGGKKKPAKEACFSSYKAKVENCLTRVSSGVFKTKKLCWC